MKRRVTPTERLLLEWLGRQATPSWGGHLKRGEPLTDSDMQRWLDNGWIEVASDQSGYHLILSLPKDSRWNWSGNLAVT